MLAETTLTHFNTFIAQHLTVEPTAGIALALTDRERTLCVGTYGYANLDAQIPVRPDHLFQIGSIGKSFTAIALLQLHEQGQLDLHAPVTQYLPWLEIPTSYEPVTIHHLLTHTAGIVTGTDESPTMFGEAWNLRHTATGCPPGDYFHYSNSGYKVLGLVLETLTGQPYAQVIRERILNPLGMDSTEPVITHTTRARHAVGYLPLPDDRPFIRPFTDKSRLAPATWFETGTADGCITSTPGDMAIYLRALLNNAKGLIQPDTFLLMTMPYIQAHTEDHSFQYGYGLDIIQKEGRDQIAHGGGMVGYYAFMLGDVNTGLGAIVLMNGPGGTYPVADFAVKTLLAEHENKPLPEIPAPKNFLDVDNANDYEGEYHSPNKALTLTTSAGKLALTPAGGDPIPLAQRAPDLFHANRPDFDGYFLQFCRDEQGNVTDLFHGTDVYESARFSIRQTVSYPSEWDAYPGHYISHNPWYPHFRIFLRKGKLTLSQPLEGDESLTEIEPGIFRVGEDERSPERLHFEAIIDGKATQAVFSGTRYYRTFTP